VILFDWGGRSGKGRNEVYLPMNIVIPFGAVEASAKYVELRCLAYKFDIR